MPVTDYPVPASTFVWRHCPTNQRRQRTPAMHAHAGRLPHVKGQLMIHLFPHGVDFLAIIGLIILGAFFAGQVFRQLGIRCLAHRFYGSSPKT